MMYMYMKVSMVALTLNAGIANIFMRQIALIIKITYSKERI